MFSYGDDCPMENEFSQFDIKLLPHCITYNMRAISLEGVMEFIPYTLMSSNFRYLILKKLVLILMHIFQVILLERGERLISCNLFRKLGGSMFTKEPWRSGSTFFVGYE